MRIAYLAAIAVLLVTFGAVLVYPGLGPADRAAAAAAIATALVVMGRRRR